MDVQWDCLMGNERVAGLIIRLSLAAISFPPPPLSFLPGVPWATVQGGRREIKSMKLEKKKRGDG